MYLPVGTVLPYSGSIDTNTKNELKNSGFLFCDGSIYKKQDYPRLYNVIKDGYAFSYRSVASAVPADSFRIPDYRGLFLRGCDTTSSVDPDYASRFNGRNVSDKVGSMQHDRFKEHKHISGYQEVGAKKDGGPWVLKNSYGQDHYTGNTEPPGGSETRPKNIYVNYIIFAGY